MFQLENFQKSEFKPESFVFLVNERSSHPNSQVPTSSEHQTSRYHKSFLQSAANHQIGYGYHAYIFFSKQQAIK